MLPMVALDRFYSLYSRPKDEIDRSLFARPDSGTFF